MGVLSPTALLFIVIDQSFSPTYCLSLLFGDGLYEPLHAFLEALFCDCGASLDGPCPVLDLHELQVAHDLLCVEGELQVLLVGEDQHGDVLEAVLGEEALELLDALLQADLIGGVNNVHESIGVLVVVLPVGADGLLTTDVPHVELEAILGLNFIVNGCWRIKIYPMLPSETCHLPVP